MTYFHMNCHLPRDQIVKSVNKLLSTTFDIKCGESVSATVNQLAVRLRRPLIAHLSFFLGASPPRNHVRAPPRKKSTDSAIKILFFNNLRVPIF